MKTVKLLRRKETINNRLCLGACRDAKQLAQSRNVIEVFIRSTSHKLTGKDIAKVIWHIQPDFLPI